MYPQESYSAYSKYLGFQGFGINDVEIRQKGLTATGARWLAKVAILEPQGGLHRCPKCGKRHAEGTPGCFQESEAILIRDCSLGDFETYVEIYPYRVSCCEGSFREEIGIRAEGFRMTVRFFERVAALCTRLPIQKVKNMANLSWDTVCRVDKAACLLFLGDTEPCLKGLRYIGVDEVSYTGKRQFFTIVSDLETGRVVYIGDGKGKKGFYPFVEKLGKRARRRIKGTASDLGYLSLLKKKFKKALHVLDRFHIVKWMNDAINKLRRRLFGGAPKDEIGKQAKELWWLLLKRREDLSKEEKVTLQQLMEQNEPLYKAYLLKEELRTILRYPWKYLGAAKRNLINWYEAAIESALPELKKVSNRIEEYIENILNGFKVPIKLGLVESINLTIAPILLLA